MWEKCHGFILENETEIPEISSQGFLFRHEKSGARLFYLKNDDDNKVFSISFRTPPKDDTGVAHIVEHSVLCGSKKFPLREPFVELVKGSLNTFLNAMTYPDKTMYPVASRNQQDFRNLMDVYLDAVFFPKMTEKKEVLLQEGWHYEIFQRDEKLKYSGVVYNEMKGAMSSPEELLEVEVTKGLFPETIYAFESGGNPEKIPELTQEKFIEFHKNYYHPSNSYIFLYGDVDLDDQLKFLDENYLQFFEKKEIDSKILPQKNFDGLREITKEYPVGDEADCSERNYLCWAVKICEADDILTKAAMTILAHALFETDAAPLRQMLLDAEIGQDINENFETQLMQPFLSVEIVNAKPEAKKFYRLCKEKIRELVTNGLDKTLLRASLNFFEFKLREEDFGQAPKGLIYNIKAMTHWLYDLPPASALFYEEIFQKLREGLETDFYEKILSRCLLENPHEILLTLKPNPTLAKEKQQALEKILAEKKAKMTNDELDAIIDETKQLKILQETPDSPENLATIPLLKLSDIRKTSEKFPLQEIEKNFFLSKQDTHGISYFNFYFDLDKKNFSQKEILYLLLLGDILGGIDTQNMSYAEISTQENLLTGGFSYGLFQSFIVNETEPLLKFVVRSRAFSRNSQETLNLLQEILLNSRFDDQKRLLDLLKQCQASLERNFQNSPQQFMATELASRVTLAGAFQRLSFVPYYELIQELVKNFDQHFEDVQKNLTLVKNKIFVQKNLCVHVTTSQENFEKELPLIKEFCVKFPEKIEEDARKNSALVLSLSEKNTGFILSQSRVQYVGRAGKISAFTGSMHVLETILRYGFLWEKIRVQGGAYGASAQFSRSGLVMFTSYRDPNLTETLDVFQKIIDFTKNFDASDREMQKFIIGTMSLVDMPKTPQAKGNLAMNLHFSKITDEMRQKTRSEILQTTVKDIRNLSKIIEEALQKKIYCVVGGEEKILSNQSIFDQTQKIL